MIALMKAVERATGSRDPFALRRQMQGVVKILMDLPELTGIDREISLTSLVTLADRTGAVEGAAWDPATVVTFGHDRIRYALEQRGFPLGVIRSAVSTRGSATALAARRIAEALRALEGSEDLRALAVLFKRVKNIARELDVPGTVGRTALVEPAERALVTELDARRPRVVQAAAAADYRGAFSEIAGLRGVVDRFFTEVFVMAEDATIRTARLGLMADLRDLVLDIADISELASDEGKQA